MILPNGPAVSKDKVGSVLHCSFCAARYPVMCAPELQRAIGDAKPTRRTVKISVFLIGRVTNSDILGGTADLLESRAQEHGPLDRPFERTIQPSCFVGFENWPLMRRDATDGNPSIGCGVVHHLGYNLLEIAHIAGIFPSKEEFAYGTVEFDRFTITTKLTEKIFGERYDILEPFAKGRQLADVARDSIIKIGRASCRERVNDSGDDVAVHKKRLGGRVIGDLARYT